LGSPASIGLIALIALTVGTPLTSSYAQQQAKDADPVKAVFRESKPTIDARARYEFGEQDGLRSSSAATIRLRFGLQTPEIRGFKFFGEFEHTEAADRNSYQAASVHGLGKRKTIIADPESSELNRLWVSYSGYDSSLKLGRQRIKLDNDRFIGNVGWRQNEQTYDGVRFENNSVDGLTLTYGYLWNVQRIFGSEGVALAGQDDFDSRSHLVNLSYDKIPNATIKVYAYMLDLENRAGDNASNDSYGISVGGKIPATDALSVGYYAEYASQRDAGDSLLDYSADYIHATLSGTLKGNTLGLGYEQLGEDKGVGFQTPLATAHKFNGFADVFLSTPGEGLIDLYAWLVVPLPFGLNLRAVYHDFEALRERVGLRAVEEAQVQLRLARKVCRLRHGQERRCAPPRKGHRALYPPAPVQVLSGQPSRSASCAIAAAEGARQQSRAPIYSTWRASIGSERVARTAGTVHAARVTPTSSMERPSKVAGSNASRLYMAAASKRVRPSARRSPIDTPHAARTAACLSTRRAIVPGEAPSAARMPNSPVRLEVA
jgi:hypothetical protein